MRPLKHIVLSAVVVLASQVIANAQPVIQIVTPQDQAFVNVTGGGPDLVDVTYQVTGNTCPGVRSTFGVVPYINGVAAACSGSGCSCDGTSESCTDIMKTITIDASAFPGCLSTIQLQMNPLPFCGPLCFTPCGGPILSNTIQVWQDPFRTCTGPTDCNKSTVGKPIDIATGKMYQEIIDFRIQGPLPIVFNRRYDSQSAYNGPMGFGWQHSYSIRITAAGMNREVFVDAHGRSVYFARDATGVWQENRIDHLILTQPGTPAWRIIDKNQTKYEFDGSGNLTKVVDRNSNALTLGYTGGNLTSITDLFGRSLTLSYYGTVPDRIHTLSAGGRTVTYTYDGNGNLTRVDYPDNSLVTYDYTDPGDVHNMTAAHDALGHLIESHVYVADRVTHSESDGGNEALDISYDSSTQTTVTNSRAVPTVYTYDSFSGLVTSSTGPGCASCGGGGESISIAYDSFLNPTEVVNGRSIHTQMTYDGKGNMLTRKEAVGTPVERLWRLTYNPTFNLPETIKIASVGTCGNPDKVVTNTYNGTTGDLTQQQVTGCNGTLPFTYTTGHTYDAHGEVKTIDGPRTDVSDVTTYGYYLDSDPDPNIRGRLQSVTNALAQPATYAGYDLFGNVGSVTDANNVETTYLYDGRDRITETRIHGSIAAEDIVTIKQYDIAGNLDLVRLPRCVDVGVGCAFSLNYGYDNVNRITEVQDAVGNKVIYTFDTESNRTREEFRDSLGVVQGFTNYAYDSFNRLQYTYFNSTVPEAPGSIFSKFSYDGNGNRLTDRDPEGHNTGFTYDELDRVGTVTHTAGVDSLVTTYGYDRLDNLTRVRDPNSSGPGSFETSYQNGDAGWRLTATSPDTGMTTYTYDPAGNLTSSLDAKGVTVNRTYDALNRPLMTSYPNSSINVMLSYDSPTVSFGIGRRTGMTDQAGSSVYHYDRRGLPKIEARTAGGTTYTTQYLFDKNGNRTQVLYPTTDPAQRQGQADFTFDAADRVSTVTAKVNGSTASVASNILYKPFGPRTRIQFGNGLVDNRSYDSRYQIGSWTLGGLLSYTYTYNNDGNLTGRTDNVNGANTRTFGYDGAHRLIQATGPWGSGAACTGGVTYAYDKNGNRLCRGEGASAINYVYTGGTNRLAASSGGEVASYAYDSNGNTSNDGAHTYQFSDADRLATVDAGSTATYTYDGDGRRAIKSAAGATTFFFYDPQGVLLTEVRPGLASGGDYLYLESTPLARVDWSVEQLVDDALRCSGTAPNVHLDWSLFPTGGNTYVVRRKVFNVFSQKIFDGNVVLATVQDPIQVYDDPVLADSNNYLYKVLRRALAESLSFYHADQIDTPIAMTNSSAALVWKVEHLPNGGIQSQSVGSITNNIRFTGQYADSETGLYQNVFRDYQPRLGRYYEPDPLGLSPGPNLWSYAVDNPVNFVDPLGLQRLGLSTIRQKVSQNKACVGVSDDLIVCMAWKESSFDPGVTSTGSTATGLLQVTKVAAKDAGCKHAEMVDPDKNIACGSGYLCLRINRARGDVKKGLEGYGTGPGYADDLLDCEQCLKTHPNKCSDQDCLDKIHK